MYPMCSGIGNSNFGTQNPFSMSIAVAQLVEHAFSKRKVSSSTLDGGFFFLPTTTNGGSRKPLDGGKHAYTYATTHTTKYEDQQSI